MDDDMKELQRVVLGDVVRAAAATDGATETEQRMETFMRGIRLPTKPPVYRHPTIPPVRPIAIQSKHR